VCFCCVDRKSNLGFGFGVWGLGLRLALNPKHFFYYDRTREGGVVKGGGQADA
jgi:hypothetical protein